MKKMMRTGLVWIAVVLMPALLIGQSGAASGETSESIVITKVDCNRKKLGTSIPVDQIGEPVSAVTLDAPVWTEGPGGSNGCCTVSGAMSPVDTSDTARPINFRVKLPAAWNQRAVHQGGAGMNGSVPDFSGRGPGGGESMEGFVLYGSDSGHSSAEDAWSLNEEAIRNIGYMQLKKTHDAAMVLIARMYGEKPKYNYFVGGSQGGREGLTVAQRYPEDYDGISSSVPIVNFSTLMLAPSLIRIQEKDLDNWVPAHKSKAVAYEFIKQCDGLDGLMDGIINNYVACREIFNVKDGGRSGENDPWKSRRCANNIDPDPNDDSINACLTDEQIETLEFVFSSYQFATPLANNVDSFGMWIPTTELGMSFGAPVQAMPSSRSSSAPAEGPPAAMPGGRVDMSGGNLLVSKRYKGQEGAAPDAPVHTHLGVLGITGFLMQDLSANPLDYVEGGKYDTRRVKLSEWLDSTNPDLSAFDKRGGKLIMTIGTADIVASSGAQLDYCQSLVNRMGQAKLDKFARLYVIPQGGHGLNGTSFILDGNGRETQQAEIPSDIDKFSLLRNWVENGTAPGKSLVVTGQQKSLPLCSYPAYPEYRSGDQSKASSYTCAQPWE